MSSIIVGDLQNIGCHVLSVAMRRNLDLASKLPSDLADMVGVCLRGPGCDVSQELAAIGISEGIDIVVFPSVTGASAETS